LHRALFFFRGLNKNPNLEGFEKVSNTSPYFYNTPKTKRMLVTSLLFSSQLKTLKQCEGFPFLSLPHIPSIALLSLLLLTPK